MIFDISDSNFYSNIKKHMRNIRETSGMTQQQLADKIGSCPSAISRMENISPGNISIQFIKRYMEACGENVSIVIGRSDHD